MLAQDTIKKAKEGSREAWNTLYEKEKSLIERTVVCKLRVKGSELDNILHDIFARVHNKLHTFKDDQPIEPWIIKIAINFCNRYYDKKTKNIDWQSISLEDLTVEKIRVVDSPEVLFISKESIEKFILFLSKYSERDFKILYMRYVEAYAYEDITKETTYNISTVKNVIRKYKKEIEEFSLMFMT